jgi:hypothetical protein
MAAVYSDLYQNSQILTHHAAALCPKLNLKSRVKSKTQTGRPSPIIASSGFRVAWPSFAVRSEIADFFYKCDEVYCPADEL